MNKLFFISILSAQAIALLSTVGVTHLARGLELTSGSALAEGQTLEDFYAAAINFSPRLRIAVESLNIGRAREEQAAGQLHPQINANANLSDNARNSFSQFGTPIRKNSMENAFTIAATNVI